MAVSALFAVAILFCASTQVFLLTEASKNDAVQLMEGVDKLERPETGFVPQKPSFQRTERVNRDPYTLEKRNCHALSNGKTESAKRGQKEAYVTLLFGNFVLGVRVLGESLKQSGTDKEMIVLTAADVSMKTKDILYNDGWTVIPLSDLRNAHPELTATPNFMTKLLTWQMTDYRRIVYIDADAIVVANVDELFRCGSYCVAFRHSDLFNCGIEVLKPSTEMFEKLHAYIPNLDVHYQDDDQVLLNEYYRELRYADMFNSSQELYCENAMRLPSGYNSDIGMYYLNSRWKMPLNEVKIIHYTLGPVKPWKWWAYTLFDLSWAWHRIRGNLRGDTEPRIFTIRNWVPPILFCLILVFGRLGSNFLNRFVEKYSILKCAWRFIGLKSTASRFLPLTFLVLSSYLSFKVIPETMNPHHGAMSFCMWCTFYHFLFYGAYCYMAYRMGLRNNVQLGERKIHTYVDPKLESVLWASLSVILMLQLYYVPFCVSPFSFRVKVFLYVLVCGVVSHHFIGQRLMRVWYGHEAFSNQTLPCVCNSSSSNLKT